MLEQLFYVLQLLTKPVYCLRLSVEKQRDVSTSHLNAFSFVYGDSNLTPQIFIFSPVNILIDALKLTVFTFFGCFVVGFKSMINEI